MEKVNTFETRPYTPPTLMRWLREGFHGAKFDDDSKFRLVGKGALRNMSVEIRHQNGQIILMDNPKKFAPSLLNKEFMRLRDKAVIVNDAQAISDAILTLPEPVYSIVSYATSVRNENIDLGEIDLVDGYKLILSKNHTMVQRDGITVLSYSNIGDYIGNDEEYLPTASKCFKKTNNNDVLRRNALLLTQDHLERIGSAYIAARAQHDPDFDPAPFLIPSVDDLERSVEQTDAGYGW